MPFDCLSAVSLLERNWSPAFWVVDFWDLVWRVRTLLCDGGGEGREGGGFLLRLNRSCGAVVGSRSLVAELLGLRGVKMRTEGG